MSRLARGAWIEMLWQPWIHPNGRRSRLARGAWIEIPMCDLGFYKDNVAPRKRRVD